MQLDLKLRFSIRISLVNWITPLSSCIRNRTYRFGACSRHFAPSF